MTVRKSHKERGERESRATKEQG